MLSHILSWIICDTFVHEVGRFTRYSPDATLTAMLVEFAVRVNYEQEAGYRHRDLLIFADSNYVGVYTRERWNVLRRKGETTGTTGSSQWQVLAYHDSCWRTDGVERFLFQHRDDLLTVGQACGPWYRKVELSPGEREALRQIRRLNQDRKYETPDLAMGIQFIEP